MELEKKFKILSSGGRSHSKLFVWLNLIQEKIESNESFLVATMNRERSQTIVVELKKRKLKFLYKFTEMGILINDGIQNAN
jgi:hypothetical protein